MLASILSVLSLVIVSVTSGFLYYRNLELSRLSKLDFDFQSFLKRFYEIDGEIKLLKQYVAAAQLTPRKSEELF